jgi:hypothetical protein
VFHGRSLASRVGGMGQATRSHRPDSGAGEPDGVVGSRVAAGHHEVTRSALDATRRRAESGAQGRRRGVRGYVGACGFMVPVFEPQIVTLLALGAEPKSSELRVAPAENDGETVRLLLAFGVGAAGGRAWPSALYTLGFTGWLPLPAHLSSRATPGGCANSWWRPLGTAIKEHSGVVDELAWEIMMRITESFPGSARELVDVAMGIRDRPAGFGPGRTS